MRKKKMMAVYKNEPKLVFSMSFQAGRRFVAAVDVKKASQISAVQECSQV